MGRIFENWPFENRAWDFDERWWQSCHIPGSVDTLLESTPHWAILAGSASSGKSVALANLIRSVDRHNTLLVELNSLFLPGRKNSQQQVDLFTQIMVQASQLLREYFWEHPGKLQDLSITQKEFFRWMVEKYNRPRDYGRWLDGLDKDLAGVMESVNTEELEIESAELQRDESMRTQIFDLVSLCRRVGFSEVLVILDVPSISIPQQMEQLKDFFTWLEPMHHGGFRCISAIRENTIDEGKLVARARGRVTTITIQISQDQALEIAGKHIQAATGGKVCRVSELASKPLINKLDKMVVDEFSQSAPGIWVQLGQMLLENVGEGNQLMSEEDFPSLRLKFYQKCMVLRIDPDSPRAGVWRGPNFIPLNQEPYDFLRELYRHKGEPVYSDQLTNISKENMHTQASRLRAAIEPDAGNKRWVYIHNRRNEGYWLENFI